jgi:hypothetical protein
MRTMKSGALALAVGIMAVAGIPSSANAGSRELAPLKMKGNWEAGQIQEAESYAEGVVDKEMINRATVWLLQEARLTENVRTFIGVGGGYFFVYPRIIGRNPYSHTKRSAFGLTDAHVEITLPSGDSTDHLLMLRAGIFNYKYNPDAKNLGEYLYRTWTYPTIITTGGLNIMDNAFAQLSGIDLNTVTHGITNDLILSIQSDHAPIYGLSLTDIVSYKLGGLLDVGAGFMLDNFYGPDKSSITPKESEGSQYYTLSTGEKMAAKEYEDRLKAQLLPVGASIVDTNYYTYAGQKAMLRASIDIGNLLGVDELLKSPFRVYGEMAILGLKNYPTYYTKIKDRTVMMGGLDIPTFGVLDNAAVEVEYCSNPFPNSTQGPYGDGPAIPHLDDANDKFPNNVRKFSRDNFKWTVYAKRKIVDGLFLHAQVANDHLRMLDVYSTPDFNDFLINPTHWYWVFKLEYFI